ncbi:MAG: ABC transporter permease subunit [Candidatus Nealsonbacteria bacterium]|nr:ABC transporter permease subunit [Candidatus Nealsonbacteria bacterium]
MDSLKRLFGLSVYTKISARACLIASLVLFVALIGVYLLASHERHQENPNDKIMPTISQLTQGVQKMATPDRNGEITLMVDTIASLKRFFLGVIAGATMAIALGVALGLFPIVEAVFHRFLLYLSKIPPLALLPVIFIFSGLGESTKILLIIVGISLPITLDTYLRVKKDLPREQLVKALTLGASTPAVVWHIVFPQIMPAALNSVRLNLLGAWLFLIAGEAIAADAGLGYRIFVVRRYMAMDTIIPYVFWIAFLSFSLDALLSWWIKRHYSWYEERN